MEFRDVLVGIFNSINGLEFDKNFDSSKFIVDNLAKTDLLFNKLILITRNSKRKRTISKAYDKYKKLYEVNPEQANPFIVFEKDKTKKYQKQYRYKDIPDGRNIAMKNIRNLIEVIYYHSIFSFFIRFKK